MKIGIGIPAYRSIVDMNHVQQWLMLGAALPSTDIDLVFVQYADVCGIERARNRLTLFALDCQPAVDWLIMCDADNYLLPRREHPHVGEALLGMVAAGAEDKDCAMIGAPVFSRDANRPRSNARRFIAGDWRTVSADDLAGQVIEVDRLGTGLVAVNIAWLREKWPEPPWFQSIYLPGRELAHIGEDDWFCDEAKKRGGEILCDGRLYPTHSDRRTA